MADNDKRRREEESAEEDLLTSLPVDHLISILSFLPVMQRVALSAVCSHFRRLLPSIPSLDSFSLDVPSPSGADDIPRLDSFPRALIRQCRVVFRDVADLPERLEQQLVEGLIGAGVRDLALETSGKGWLNLSGRENCGFFGVKSLRSLSLDSIRVSRYSDRRRPLRPLGCALLASLKMEFCVLRDDFLRNLLASCPFLETLQLIRCYGLGHGMNKLSIHSASIKRLVLLCMIPGIVAIDIRGPKLESLIVDVVPELRIEAPKAQTASFLLALEPPADPPRALTNLFRAAFRRGAAWLMLNPSKTPNIVLAAENGIDRFISPEYKEDTMIFDLDFDLKDRSSTMVLTEFLKQCNDCNTRFDIRVDSTRIQSAKEDDDDSLDGSTEVELIKLRMIMPDRTFRAFLSNEKKTTEELKEMGLEILRSRTGKQQFMRILASKKPLFQGSSSSVANCIEMRF